MGSARVTVGIPVRNGAPFIEETIRSVLAQTMADFELVVFDNASTDGTADVVRGMGDGRVHLERNEADIGAGANFNRVLTETSAPYVKVLSADDVLHPSCLERQAAVLDDPGNADVVLVTSRRDVIDRTGRRLTSRGFGRVEGRVDGKDAVRRIVRSGTNLVGEPSATLIRRSVLPRSGLFGMDSPYTVDVDLWIRMLAEGDLYVIGDALIGYRVIGTSWSVAVTERQALDMIGLVDRTVLDPRFGLRAADGRHGRFGARTNALLRRFFYGVALRGGAGPAVEGRPAG